LNVDGVIDLQVVKDQIPRFVGVADTDRVERHAGPRRMLGGDDEIIPVGIDAVGEQYDSGQGRTPELLNDRFDSAAEPAAGALRLQAANRFDSGASISAPIQIGDPLRSFGTADDVELHLPAG